MCQEGEARGKNQEGESAAAKERWIQFFCAPQFCGAGLCALPAAVGLCAVKKDKNKSRKVGKAQGPPEVLPSGYNFFASLREEINESP